MVKRPLVDMSVEEVGCSLLDLSSREMVLLVVGWVVKVADRLGVAVVA